MKKFFKILFGIIGGLIALIIVLTLVIGLLMYDKTDNSNEEITSDNHDLETLLYAYVENSLEETNTNEKVELLLTEYKVNLMLNSLKNTLSIPFVEIKSMYSIFNTDGTVSFEAPISFAFFKSCLKGKLDIVMEDDGTLKVILSGINVGKFGTDSAFIRMILFGSINKKKIEKALMDKGIALSIEKSNKEITVSMTKDNIADSVNNLSKDSSSYLIKALVDEFLGNKDIFDFKFNDDDVIGAILYLERLKYSGELEYDLEKTSVTLEDLKNKSITLIENGVMVPKNSMTVFDYLVRGYDKLDDKSKGIIDGLDFSSIGIISKKTYSGIVERSSLTMAKIFLDAFQINPLEYASYITGGYFDIKITESSLNELFNSFGFIGTSMAFMDGSKVSYISIESLYTEIEDNLMRVYLVLNVNGYEIYAKLNTSLKSQENALLTLKIDSINLGSEELSESVRFNLLKFLESSFKDEEVDFISVDPENETMALDFTNYLEGEFYEYIIQAGLNKISFLLSSAHNGELIMRFSR